MLVSARAIGHWAVGTGLRELGFWELNMIELSTTMTVGDVVAHDLRSAAVFARHGIDFCCGGRRSIEEVCREKGVNAETVLQELADVDARGGTPEDLTTLPIGRIIERILENHHTYIRAQIPVIQAYLAKLAAKKGDLWPDLRRIEAQFTELAHELTRHMEKEETILFPFIEAMLEARAQCRRVPRTPFGTIQNPVRMMELEHQQAGSEMWGIRVLTNNFQPPADACVTWRACYAELEAFERDLHQHVHLENNVLFPAAARLEEELS
jgi:regulator of cell morphogenesis and NO signaling